MSLPLVVAVLAVAAVVAALVAVARVRARRRREVEKISGGRKSLVSNLFRR